MKNAHWFLTALPCALLSAAPALAQEARPAGDDGSAAATPDVAVVLAPADAERRVRFAADRIEYDSEADVVTASGDVRMESEGNRLAAERVIWTRATGEVRAEGAVSVADPQGDVVYGENVVLADTLRDGAVENLLLVLESGGRLAADRATREDGVTTLFRANYSACPVVDEDGCPRSPTWNITAVRVVVDPVANRIRYRGAALRLFGVPIVALPGFSHPAGGEGGGSGLLVPDLRVSRSNGVEVALPYYKKLAPNRDLTITPHLYSEVLPALEARYRHLTELGAYQLGGIITYGRRRSATLGDLGDSEQSIRGYFEANGRLQLDPLWTLTASARVASDRTFLRRYDISRDDRLRSVLNAERIAERSYVSIAGWGFQGLRATDVAGQQPIAVPAIDARFRTRETELGGRLELQANTLGIIRRDGQDTQRAFVRGQWDLRRLTPLGQELRFTALVRGDLYHTDESLETATAIYRGEDGWQARGIAALAAEVRWPLIGSLFGLSQRLTPRVQLVASPPTENLSIPNEDARALELEDSNLFALNRFPGYDRWEDGARVTYGADWSLDGPNLALRATVGQSYRLDRQAIIAPPGTGLGDRLSDIVGRTSLRYGRQVELVHRYRLDKDSLGIRRNEVDLTVGSYETYLRLGYLRLNRDISLDVEDLRDREEVRAGGRVKFLRHWSVFGSAVVDLTDAEEDPLSSADGYEPVRHRLGLAYEDECAEFALTWRRDYDGFGDFGRGNTFQLRVSLKNLGR